ncbi:hypothetical protein BC828DRAFT_396457 [Blastocladiella britannica]|nr:hypothetical protein BC828DRAFT_396457 [Blastocladiella britannica]
MLALLHVLSGLHPVARVAILYLPHCRVSAVAVSGRVEILARRKELGLQPLPGVDFDPKTVLQAASRWGHIDLLRWYAAQRDRRVKPPAPFPLPPTLCLTLASIGEHVDALDWWLDESGADVNEHHFWLGAVLQKCGTNLPVLQWWFAHARALGPRSAQGFPLQTGGAGDGIPLPAGLADNNFSLLLLIQGAVEVGDLPLVQWWRAHAAEVPAAFPGGQLNLSADALDAALFEWACAAGNVRLLQWIAGLHRARPVDQWPWLPLVTNLLDNASVAGHANLLSWWAAETSAASPPLSLVYSSRAMDDAGSCAVLDWWKQSGLPLKFSDAALCTGVRNARYDLLEWWRDSGFAFSVSEQMLLEASVVRGSGKAADRIAMLGWSVSAAEKGHLPISSRYMDYANDPAILEWWVAYYTRTQGLSTADLPYTEHALHRACLYGRLRVLEWWLRSGLPLKFSHRAVELAAMSTVRMFPTALEWWASSLPCKWRGDLSNYADLLAGPTAFREGRVRGLCLSKNMTLTSGGLPPPEGGYRAFEDGEEDLKVEFC